MKPQQQPSDTDAFSRLPPAQLIDTPARMGDLRRALAAAPRLAVDTESNSLYAYRERVCLIQISTDQADYLIDPIQLEGRTSLAFLGEVFADPTVEKVFHAAEYDVMTLHRDFGFTFANIFDTMIAASVLGWQQVGLGAILMERYGVKVDKRHQRANWGRRPLPPTLIRYAQMDTHYLLHLRDEMWGLLEQGGHLEEAREMFDAVCRARWGNADFAPEGYWRISGARDLDRRGMAVLRELYHWREQEAQRCDVPVFKVLSDQSLIRLARTRPRSLDEMRLATRLAEGQMRRYGNAILRAIEAGLRAEPPTVPVRHNGLPADEATLRRYEALHIWRKERAAQRGVSSEVIVSREALWELAIAAPRSPEHLEAIHSLGPWRIKTYGAEILDVIAKTDGAD